MESKGDNWPVTVISNSGEMGRSGKSVMASKNSLERITGSSLCFSHSSSSTDKPRTPFGCPTPLSQRRMQYCIIWKLDKAAGEVGRPSIVSKWRRAVMLSGDSTCRLYRAATNSMALWEPMSWFLVRNSYRQVSKFVRCHKTLDRLTFQRQCPFSSCMLNPAANATYLG